MQSHPILYSYRRCPYAMRARMAIAYSGIQVEQREIVFWDKPAHMLEVSPKGTVPVLILPDGSVVDESRDIMLWALNNAKTSEAHNGEQAWLCVDSPQVQEEIAQWITLCDDEFKPHLDHYKYADRFPENSKESYREQGCAFLKLIEKSLAVNLDAERDGKLALIGEDITMADIAVFPFIRQFVNVDKIWFEDADYPCLKKWLAQNLESAYFKAVMKNRPVWIENHNPLWVDEPDLLTKNEFTDKAVG